MAEAQDSRSMGSDGYAGLAHGKPVLDQLDRTHGRLSKCLNHGNASDHRTSTEKMRLDDAEGHDHHRNRSERVSQVAQIGNQYSHTAVHVQWLHVHAVGGPDTEDWG